MTNNNAMAIAAMGLGSFDLSSSKQPNHRMRLKMNA
eukprot:CAMPEP_0169063964 /NCGR_PEP_ID=MMETSP1015-20121227/1574_1 /TAXON_ID=342587 /ORGANISM="Karlodinium micrum, Strain CCMP2283" /LENGTH=35 /DNA_ID= /DNA_START= /DNA_END= /DNA_ORIENTATION=